MTTETNRVFKNRTEDFYRAGAEAFTAGIPRFMNPYTFLGWRHRAWSNGWLGSNAARLMGVSLTA